jgi:hypothetical protein
MDSNDSPIVKALYYKMEWFTSDEGSNPPWHTDTFYQKVLILFNYYL